MQSARGRPSGRDLDMDVTDTKIQVCCITIGSHLYGLLDDFWRIVDHPWLERAKELTGRVYCRTGSAVDLSQATVPDDRALL